MTSATYGIPTVRSQRIWTAGMALSRMAGGVAVILIAGIVGPQEFGLFAAVLLASGLMQVICEAGAREALIAADQVDERQLSTCFWLLTACSLVVTLACAALSGVIAIALSAREAAGLIALVSACGVFHAMSQTHTAVLERALRFRGLFWAEVMAVVAQIIISVALVIYGYQALGLVAGVLVSYVCRSGITIWAARDIFKLRLVCDFRSITALVDFAKVRLVESVFQYITQRVDQLAISVILGPIALAYYTFAWRIIVDLILKLNVIFTRVLFASVPRVRGDTAKTSRLYCGTVRDTLLLTAPVACGLAIVAPHAFPLWGAQWSNAAELAVPMGVMAVVRSCINPVGALLLGLGKQVTALCWNVAVTIAMFAAVVLLCFLTDDLRSAAWGLAAVWLLVFWAHWIVLLSPILRALSLADYLRSTALVPLTIAGGVAMAMYAPAALMPTWEGVTAVVAQVLSGGGVYASIMAILFLASRRSGRSGREVGRSMQLR